MTDAEGDAHPVKVPGAGSMAPAKAADPGEGAAILTPTEAGDGGAAREDASLHDASPQQEHQHPMPWQGSISLPVRPVGGWM